MFKFSMLFNFQGQGFSESWYTATGTMVNSRNELDPLFQALAASRDLLTAKYVNLIGLRLSDLSNPRNTSTYIYNPTVTAGAAPDTVTNSYLVNVRGANNKGNRSLFIRGLPDDAIQWNETARAFVPVGVMTKNFANYGGILTNGSWLLRYVTPVVKPYAPGQEINSITPSPTQNAVLIGTSGAMTSQNGPLIVAGFKKPLSSLNGTYIFGSGYSTSGGAAVNLLGRGITPQQAATYVVNSASVRPQQFNFVAVSKITIEFPRERRTGRAFFVPAGRRRSR